MISHVPAAPEFGREYDCGFRAHGPRWGLQYLSQHRCTSQIMCASLNSAAATQEILSKR